MGEPVGAAPRSQGPVSVVSRASQLQMNNNAAAAVFDPGTRTLYLGGESEGHADVLPQSGVAGNPEMRGLTVIRDERGNFMLLNSSATFARGADPGDIPAVVEALRTHLGVLSMDVDMTDPYSGLD